MFATKTDKFIYFDTSLMMKDSHINDSHHIKPETFNQTIILPQYLYRDEIFKLVQVIAI